MREARRACRLSRPLEKVQRFRIPPFDAGDLRIDQEELIVERKRIVVGKAGNRGPMCTARPLWRHMPAPVAVSAE